MNGKLARIQQQETSFNFRKTEAPSGGETVVAQALTTSPSNSETEVVQKGKKTKKRKTDCKSVEGTELKVRAECDIVESKKKKLKSRHRKEPEKDQTESFQLNEDLDDKCCDTEPDFELCGKKKKKRKRESLVKSDEAAAENKNSPTDAGRSKKKKFSKPDCENSSSTKKKKRQKEKSAEST